MPLRKAAIVKSTRHSRIIGDFGEMMVVNWLSRSGFEVALVDHTGIDIIAKHPRLRRPLGISVKARTRLQGQERSSVNLFSYGGKKDARKCKIMLDACAAFGCTPWLAVYVECKTRADLYMTSLSNYDNRYCRRGRKVEVWGMSKQRRNEYAKDPKVMHIGIDLKPSRWFWAVRGGK